MESGKRLLNTCNIYILLWALWIVQDLFLESTFMSMIFYIPFLMMSCFYFIKAVLSRPKGVAKVLIVFFLFLLVYGVLLFVQDDVKNVDNKSFLLMLFSSLAPVFSFYVFTLQGKLNEKRLSLWFFILLAVYILSFYTLESKNLILHANKYNSITNNTSYMFCGLFPFLFLFKDKRLLQYLCLAVLLYFVVIGLKRGAMLCFSVLLVMFVYDSIKRENSSKKMLIMLFTLVFLLIGIELVTSYYNSSLYFQRRIEITKENGLGARGNIYTILLNHYKTNDSLFHLLFGEGANHTLVVTGKHKAHNDWLELLIDCGFLGVFIYFIYWINFFSDWRRVRNDVRFESVYIMMAACLIFTFTRSFFSMSFSDLPFGTTMIMGYCFGKVDIYKQSLLYEYENSYT